jgi:methionyl-tRNA synthetase
MATQTYYITTPIYYVNDMPHIGHIYTTVMADVPWHGTTAWLGHDVRFLTGTDEHGQKIEKSRRGPGASSRSQLADSRGGALPPAVAELLDISNDDFIRTTEPRHKARGGRDDPPHRRRR